MQPLKFVVESVFGRDQIPRAEFPMPFENRKFKPTRIRRSRIVLVAGVLLISSSALGQSPGVPNLEGTWSDPTQMLEDEAWRFEDYACFMGCPLETYQYAHDLFSNEQNFDRSFAELSGMVLGRRMQAIMAKLSPEARQRAARFDLADDPAIRCEPYGFARQALTPVSIDISQSDSTVLIDYEVWEARRTIHLGQPVSNGAPARLGYSAGRYDEGVLIVETGGISEDFVATGLGAIHTTNLRAIERYSVSDDGEQLELEISFVDPGVLTEPLTFRKAWRRTPDAEFLPWDCRLLDTP